jgi:hypothetical protein
MRCQRMYGGTQEWSIYHLLTIELHISKKEEGEASENREMAVGEVEDEILTRSRYPPQVLNPFHETSKHSSVKWQFTARNQFLRAPLVDS